MDCNNRKAQLQARQEKNAGMKGGKEANDKISGPAEEKKKKQEGPADKAEEFGYTS